MDVATWNVNSIRARLERVLDWLRQAVPDVLCLQELKADDDAFPREPLAEAGYHAAVHGQRTYNGVAILARTPPENVAAGMDDGAPDPQARLIAADVAGVRVFSAYVPNGQTVGSEAWAYKLDWLGRLDAYLRRSVPAESPAVLCGDFNVAPDDKDVAYPDAWADSVLCGPPARAAMAAVRDAGWIDLLRRFHPDGGVYTWWDYRRGAFRRGDGLRLDHVWATAPLAARCTAVRVDRDERAGPKPSDHAPVVATFS